MTDYWSECISEALDDAGVLASPKQIDIIAGWVEGAHENHGTETGRDMIPNPLEAELKAARLSRDKEVRTLEDGHARVLRELRRDNEILRHKVADLRYALMAKGSAQ